MSLTQLDTLAGVATTHRVCGTSNRANKNGCGKVLPYTMFSKGQGPKEKRGICKNCAHDSNKAYRSNLEVKRCSQVRKKITYLIKKAKKTTLKLKEVEELKSLKDEFEEIKKKRKEKKQSKKLALNEEKQSKKRTHENSARAIDEAKDRVKKARLSAEKANAELKIAQAYLEHLE